jgi:two-component system, OmpR family, phosphate regulon sensor histidine kinase PhoR
VLVLALVVLLALGLRSARGRLRSTRGELDEVSRDFTHWSAVQRRIADALDVGVGYYRTDGALGFANAAMVDMARRSGFRAESGMPAGYFVYGDDRERPLPFDEQIIPRARRGEFAGGTVFWVGPPGDQRAVLAATRPLTDAGGQSLGFAFFAYDVTDMQNSIRVREEFLATVSHELKTPLTSVLGFLDVALDRIDVVALGVDREFGIIEDNIGQLQARIADLLTFTGRGVSIFRRDVDLQRLVQERIGQMASRARNADIRFSSGPPLSAEVDARRVEQVLDNLLSNAVKFSPPGSAIDVTLDQQASQARLRVMDAGMGMSADEQVQAFDRFFRGAEARNQAVPGVGLGLTIVRTIVLAHGGRVDVESVPGRGTTFTVVLPLRSVGRPLSVTDGNSGAVA